MAFITLSDLPKRIDPYVEMSYEQVLDFHHEYTGADTQFICTIVGQYADIVSVLALLYRHDDMGLAFLVSEIQLDDASMNEHNAAASAVGL